MFFVICEFLQMLWLTIYGVIEICILNFSYTINQYLQQTITIIAFQTYCDKIHSEYMKIVQMDECTQCINELTIYGVISVVILSQ